MEKTAADPSVTALNTLALMSVKADQLPTVLESGEVRAHCSSVHVYMLHVRVHVVGSSIASVIKGSKILAAISGPRVCVCWDSER